MSDDVIEAMARGLAEWARPGDGVMEIDRDCARAALRAAEEAGWQPRRCAEGGRKAMSDGVIEATVELACETYCNEAYTRKWADYTEEEREIERRMMRKALTAAIRGGES